MFDMFKGIGQFASIMRQLPKMREEMERIQEKLGQMTAEGDAGAGMVKVRVNGRLEVLGVSISEELLEQNDREMLEDLLKAAINQALVKARQQMAEEGSKLMGGLNLPAGMNLPGLG